MGLPPYAILSLVDDVVYAMVKERIVVGRGTAVSPVDIDVGNSSFVSRRHLELQWINNSVKLLCNGKNGIFVNKVFRPSDSKPHAIPSRCVLRFPSTSICIRVKQCRRSFKRTSPRFRTAGFSRSLPIVDGISASDLDVDDYDEHNRKRPSSEESCSPDVPNSDSNPLPRIPEWKSRTRRKQTLVPSSFVASSECLIAKQPTASNSLPDSVSETLEKKTDNRVPQPASGTQLIVQSTVHNQLPTTSASPAATVPHGQLVIAPLSTFPRPALLHLTNLTTLDRGDQNHKPPYSYAQLIAQAIANQPARQVTLSGIYTYISQNYPYYRPQDKGWQNSVRHNLSLNRHFVKVPRSQDDHGKGCFWRIDPLVESKILAVAFRRRSRGYDGLLLHPPGLTSRLRLSPCKRNLSCLGQRLPYQTHPVGNCISSATAVNQPVLSKVLLAPNSNLSNTTIAHPDQVFASHTSLPIQTSDIPRTTVPVSSTLSHVVRPTRIILCYSSSGRNPQN